MKNWCAITSGCIGIILILEVFSTPKILPASFFNSSQDIHLSVPSAAAEDHVQSIPTKIPILMLHIVRPIYPTDSEGIKTFGVSPEIFNDELSYLDQHNFNVISFDDVYNYFKERKPLPKNPIVISFDDGWKDQYEYAFPILKAHHMTATFFVFTNAMTNDHYLSWDNLKEMQQAGMSIESHSVTHPYLTKIQDEKELEHEIVDSKKAIEEHLGTTVEYFAYPFGLFDDRIIAMLQQAGYKAARGTAYGTLQSENRLFNLKVVNVNNDYVAFIRNIEN